MSKWKRPLAVLMAVICSICCASPSVSHAANVSATVQEKSTQTVNYVALGDSITAGGGTYVGTVSKYLSQKYGNCKTDNLAMDGWTSSNLLDALTNPSNAMYNRMNSALANADYVTLDIGSNDLMIGAMEIIADCFGCTYDQLGAVTGAWSQKISNATGIYAGIIYMQAMSIATSIRYRLLYGSEITKIVKQYETNYQKIITAIKTVAPNAKIYVGNLYNPYVDAAPVYLGSYCVVNLESFAATNMVKMNNIIARHSAGLTVVDLYNTINNPMYIKGDVVNYDYDPHPNQAGHNAIANKFIAAIS